jgi:hypothetical protein
MLPVSLPCQTGKRNLGQTKRDTQALQFGDSGMKLTTYLCKIYKPWVTALDSDGSKYIQLGMKK